MDDQIKNETKLKLFFSMLAGTYGEAKIRGQWPTEFDEQTRNKIWEERICSLSLEELREAIDNATRQQEMGESEFMWPNIGLILSGSRRFNTASHRPHLPAPKGTKESESIVKECLDDMRKGL